MVKFLLCFICLITCDPVWAKTTLAHSNKKFPGNNTYDEVFAISQYGPCMAFSSHVPGEIKGKLIAVDTYNITSHPLFKDVQRENTIAEACPAPANSITYTMGILENDHLGFALYKPYVAINYSYKINNWRINLFGGLLYQNNNNKRKLHGSSYSFDNMYPYAYISLNYSFW